MIVQLGQEESGPTKSTHVKKDSVKHVSQEETAHNSYFEATLEQNPDIEGLMDKLAMMLVKCHVDSTTQDLHRVFTQKLQEAENNQLALGNKATWREIHWLSLVVSDDEEESEIT